MSPCFCQVMLFQALHQGLVIRKMDSPINRIVIFQLPQNGIKSNDTRDIKLARDKK